MPELKEAIARLREHELRIAEANGADAEQYCGDLRQVLDAAEEVERLRADKERLLKAARSCVAFRGAQCDDDEEVVRLRSVVDDIDAARSLQTNGRGSESTAEAKQEASPARKEKTE